MQWIRKNVLHSNELRHFSKEQDSKIETDLDDWYDCVCIITLDVDMCSDPVLNRPVDTASWQHWHFAWWCWTLTMTSSTTTATLLLLLPPRRRRRRRRRWWWWWWRQIHLVFDDDLNASSVFSERVFVYFKDPFEHIFNPATGSTVITINLPFIGSVVRIHTPVELRLPRLVTERVRTSRQRFTKYV